MDIEQVLSPFSDPEYSEYEFYRTSYGATYILAPEPESYYKHIHAPNLVAAYIGLPELNTEVHFVHLPSSGGTELLLGLLNDDSTHYHDYNEMVIATYENTFGDSRFEKSGQIVFEPRSGEFWFEQLSGKCVLKGWHLDLAKLSFRTMRIIDSYIDLTCEGELKAAKNAYYDGFNFYSIGMNDFLSPKNKDYNGAIIENGKFRLGRNIMTTIPLDLVQLVR